MRQTKRPDPVVHASAVTLPARSIGEFHDRILVDCPRCAALAVVTPSEPVEEPRDLPYAARRMVCTRCGLVRTQPRRALSRPDMGLALRLQARSRHGILVAINEMHLDELEAWVAARLRRETVAPGGIRNRSHLSRLPAWVKAAGNRDEVLGLIANMRKRLRD